MTMLVLILLSVVINVHLLALNNDIKLTPLIMGWTHWQYICNYNCTNKCISEQYLKNRADLLVQHKYFDAGYKYIFIDDCWILNAFKANKQLLNKIKNTLHYMHEKSLQIGININNKQICSENHSDVIKYLENHAKVFAKMKIDIFKFNGCKNNVTTFANFNGENSQPFFYFHEFPPIQFTIENDEMNFYKNRIQMTLCAIISAPIIISIDLTNVQTNLKTLLQNREIIAIHQDQLLLPGKQIIDENDEINIWTRKITPIIDGHFSFAIFIINVSNVTRISRRIVIKLSEIEPEFNAPKYIFYDLFNSNQSSNKPTDTLSIDPDQTINGLLLKAIPVIPKKTDVSTNNRKDKYNYFYYIFDLK